MKNPKFKLDKNLADEISSFLFALGNEFIRVRNAEGAFDCFKYSLDLNPKNQPSVFNLGCLYVALGNYEGARRMFLESCRMLPNDVQSTVSLGEVERKLGNLKEAENLMRTALKLDSGSFAALSGLALVSYDCGQIAEAEKYNEEALAINPGDDHLILNKTLLGMMRGDWPRWWASYEASLSYKPGGKMGKLSMSGSWDGREHEGESLLVVSDQGSGDAIQFSRYLKEAKQLGKFSKLAFLVQPDLVELLKDVDGIDEILAFEQKPAYKYDRYSSLLGIMRVLKVSEKNCRRFPHIYPDNILAKWWLHFMGGDPSKPKVGITWSGDPRHGNDGARSLSVANAFEIVNRSQNICNFYSFQVDRQAEFDSMNEISEIKVVDLGSNFRDFKDTAAALSQMDLMVCCDTSVAHLAGSMGVECWVMLPNPPEWRWLEASGTTPWYDSVRLFRQMRPRTWSDVIGAVVEELQYWTTAATSDIKHANKSRVS